MRRKRECNLTHHAILEERLIEFRYQKERHYGCVRTNGVGPMLPRLIGCACFFVVYLASETCFAGPPFLTDDPVPVDRGHWEINNFSAGTLVKGAFAGAMPGVDANYGSWLCKNSTTRGGDRTNVRPTT